MEEESKLCVYLRCGRALFWGRQGSGKAPLEDHRHSQKRPEGNEIQRSGRRTRPKNKKVLEKIKPPTESNPQPLRDSLFIHDGQDPPFCLRRYPAEREQWWPGFSLRVPHKHFMYNKQSHRKSKKSAPRIIPERKFQKLPERRRKKR